MNSEPIAGYLTIQQVRDMFNFDLPQLKHAISQNELRLWAYIGNKKRDFDKQPISAIDLNYIGMPSKEEINRLDKLTVNEIENEGWSITHLSPPHNFIAHKGKLCFMVTHENGTKGFRLPIPDDADTVEHDGFIEIDYEKSPFDKKQNLALLFSESELYLGQAKSNKTGYMRLLRPGCYITLNDVYIHQDELKKLNKQSQGSPQMLPHIRTSNLLKRADQIANLFNQICVEYPIRIDIEKITQPAQLVNLAWIIAFCRMKYDSYADVSYKDFALNAMAESIRKTLIDTLQASGELHKLNAKYYDEVDFATETTVTKILSYKLPPDLISSVLMKDQTFNKYLIRNDKPSKQTAEEAPQKVESASPENKALIKTKKKSPLMRILLEGFVEHLVTKTDYDTYPKFVDLMTVQYLIKEGAQLSDEEKFNEYERIKHVYCIRSRKNDAGELKNIKYLIHYSTVNDSGDLVSRKPYSLSSFQKIFDTVRKRLKANEPKITHGNLTVSNGS